MEEFITDLETIRQHAQAEEDQNIRFRQFLKYRLNWSDRRLDESMLEILREVEAGVDCTQCANCCRVLQISLEQEDLERLAEHLGKPVEDIKAQYAAPGADYELGFAHRPCAFLQEDSRCSVYPGRPRDCREYPHLQKGEFRQRMWQVLMHAEDCPIVFNTLERMKALFRFR